MDIVNNQRIKVDFKKATVNETLLFRQYDTNIIEIEIFDNGVPANLSGVTSIVANLQRQDEKIYSHILTAVGNLLTIELTNIEMELLGELKLAVQFYSGKKRLSTTKIKLYIEDTIEVGDIPTHQEISIIEGLVELVNESLEMVGDYRGRIQELESDLNERGVNAKQFGASGDIVTNDSIKLQELIDKVRQEVIDSQFTASNVIIIPSGRYRLETQLIMSPFLKLKAAGLVVFETYIPNESALWITPRSDDPLYLNIMGKQQWFRSPIINGTDGGILFINKLDRHSSKSTAIEFGSRVNVGEYRPLSRYTVSDIAVQGYDVGFKMNRFNHYLGTFERLHLELNNTLVVYGDENTIVENSGENFNFLNCVFAGSRTCFQWLSDGFDTHFTNCSFDFNGTVWHMSRGFKIITMTGGHIEGVDNGILLEDSKHQDDAGVGVTVALNAVSILAKKQMMFVGSKNVHLTLNGIDYRQLGANSETAIDNSFWIDDRITIKRRNITIQQRTSLIQKKLNDVYDWTFEKETNGVKSIATGLNNYSIRGENVLFEVVNSDSSLGGKALKITGTNNGPWSGVTTGAITANAGDYIIMNVGVKYSALTNIVAKIDFYNQFDERIQSDTIEYRWIGPLREKLDEWFYPDYAAETVAPKGTTYYKLEFQVNGAPLVGKSVYLTGLYATTFQ